VGQDSATVSGPGQFFSQLQQLQSQDPTEFKQIASTIASQLQTAASQTTGNQSQFLSTLATNFNTAATTGNLTSLEPHHRSHEGHGTYNQAGQVTPTSSATTASSTSTGGLNVQQLFANISSEVTQALAGITSGTSGTTATPSVPGQS
jgi:HSP90 family molecular chaperone